MAAPVTESDTGSDTGSNTGSHTDPCRIVRRFLEAVLWAEHITVWEMLTPSAREVALAAAARRGLDAVAAERARQGTWTNAERDRLLGALVVGLGVDLGGADLDHVTVGPAIGQADGAVVLQLAALSTLPKTITLGQGWPVGRVVLVSVGGSWLVDRIVR